MNPIDGMYASPAASGEQAPDDGGVYRDTQAATWDPYEVWLTRIKQPRERAARIARGTSASSSLALGARVMTSAR